MIMPMKKLAARSGQPAEKTRDVSCTRGVLLLSLFFSLVASAVGQVGPAEITNPRIKAVEQAYLGQMMEMNRAVARINFPFSFALSRYAGLSPKDQIGADTRGLEFVLFHGRLVLKLTGNYNAAYSAEVLTANQRAARLFDDVIRPVLRVFRENFTPGDRFDDFGVEIAYHVRTRGHGFEYEGKEILVVVMAKSDALNFPLGEDEAKQQVVLNRSEIYLDGKPLGLALGSREPFDAEALRLPSKTAMEASAPVSAADARPDPAPRISYQAPVPHSPAQQLPKPESPAGGAPGQAEAIASTVTPRPDPDTLQKKYQAELDQLAADGAAKHHFVGYAPPSFVVFRGQIALQISLSNPSIFSGETTSIYKRAAQSFDLFFAPQLKPILDKIPKDPDVSSLDATVIDQLDEKSGRSSEALEFILPLKAARAFVDYEITNQQLIDQSIVLVNGVRITLNLQAVE